MFYKMENGKFVGFYEDKDKDGNYTEITIEDWQGILDKQSQGEVIFYNVKNKKLETIKLNRFETIKNGEIEFDRAVKIEYLKTELSTLKVEFSEKEFLFKGKYLQKNRERGDRDSLTGLVVLLMATNQNTYDGWKVIDKETGEHVYLKLTLDDFKLMALHMQEQVTKAMKVESELIVKLNILSDNELKAFDSRKEYESLWS